MTPILRKLRDDVAGMRVKHPTNLASDGYNIACAEVLALIDAAIAAQPEPDELVARLQEERDLSWKVAEDMVRRLVEVTRIAEALSRGSVAEKGERT